MIRKLIFSPLIGKYGRNSDRGGLHRKNLNFTLPHPILKWYANDFGRTNAERLKWILPFLKVRFRLVYMID